MTLPTHPAVIPSPLAGESGRRPGESGHHHARSNSSVDALGSTGAVERGVAKLFREKVRGEGGGWRRGMGGGGG
jgi:hypothetical protein